ncbi:hypothetical protein C2U34_08145 [Ralstonia solanacearum]|nr:hypothetical protein CIG66_23505 [Ralstonia pseudosolanacearum]TYZ41366.1 hypothetical protein C2U33_17635 [Ralstonia solanacearum]TYZ48313.1 hypothetical protein C2U34_08145 [Ralstonia solanacearum]TYZ51439.1 hypothetical protein C2U35_07710 [Ralstonia solanacearum]
MKFIKSSGLSITHRIPNIVAVHPRQQPLAARSLGQHRARRTRTSRKARLKRSRPDRHKITGHWIK